MRSASLTVVCPVYLCANVGPWGATRRSACPVLHHSESGPLGSSVSECGAAGSAGGQTACPVRPTLRQSRSRHANVSPFHPGCPSPPLLPVWMNVCFLFPWCRTSLPFNFLSVLVVRGGAVCLSTPPSWFQSISDFFYNSLVVRVPCSLIFWHSWLFIDFRLVVILLLGVQGSEGFVPTPPSWLELYLFILDRREGREKEGEKHQSVVASCAPPTGNLIWPVTQARTLTGNGTTTL